jgi:serine/threonine protein phosphatase PrpC
VKSCPTCGASCGDDDRFCEADGTVLVAGAVAAGACSRCGLASPDDGDGYCRGCGDRLAHLQTAAPPPPLAAGTTIDGVIVNDAGPASSTLGTRGSTPVLMVRGAAPALDAERDALALMAGDPRLPAVVGRVDDPTHGAFLLLSAPPPHAVAPEVSLATAAAMERCGRELLSLLSALEQARITASPLPGDLRASGDGVPHLVRLRAARSLAPGERLDPRGFLSLLARDMPLAWMTAPLGLLRVVAGAGRGSSAAGETLDVVLAALDVGRVEIASPTAAASRDAGLVRDHDQDATAIAAGDHPTPWTVLVVCDGVSSSSRSDEASALAARTARDALAHFLRVGDADHEAVAGAVATAIRAAHIAVCAELGKGPDDDLPGTTIVAALVHRGRATVGWVGDSRAYWIGPGGAELLTRDHSWVTEVVAAGVMDEATAKRSPEAHVITRCLGPLEVGDLPREAVPDVRGRDLPGPGLLVLCSDGLWNYADHPDALARVVRALAPDAPADHVARALVGYAIARGGSDNVSVAVYRHHASA